MMNIDPRWGNWKDAPPSIPESAVTETIDCDVAVAGAGIAGGACACRAAQNGLRVDGRCAVLDEKGSPVPGLYAAGNTMGGRYGVDYPMVIPGTSHGTALTFGWLLGEILAGKEGK